MAEMSSLFGRAARAAFSRFPRNESHHCKACFSFYSERGTDQAHSQPSREPERSCVGGRSLCMGDAASERCEGSGGKAGTDKSVTFM